MLSPRGGIYLLLDAVYCGALAVEVSVVVAESV